MKRLFITFSALMIFSTQAYAELHVVATLPWIGSLVHEIGKEKVEVSVLVKPSQDPHFIDAKPSMILAARKADALFYNGLDLEIGYLPIIIESSKNPMIQAGQTGNHDCSQHIEAIEKPTTVDRSLGDVHPLGNPHYHLSPKNVEKAAEGIAETLSALDPINAGFYKNNLQSFQKRLAEKQAEWAKRPLRGKRFIAFHKLFEYLSMEFGFQIIGYIEPKPGIPPSAGHLKNLIDILQREKPDAILTTTYYGKKEALSLSEKSGVRHIIVPHDVGSMEGPGDWFQLMDKILSSLEG